MATEKLTYLAIAVENLGLGETAAGGLAEAVALADVEHGATPLHLPSIVKQRKERRCRIRKVQHAKNHFAPRQSIFLHGERPNLKEQPFCVYDDSYWAFSAMLYHSAFIVVKSGEWR